MSRPYGMIVIHFNVTKKKKEIMTTTVLEVITHFKSCDIASEQQDEKRETLINRGIRDFNNVYLKTLLILKHFIILYYC